MTRAQATSVAEAERRLEAERATLARLEGQSASAQRAADAATPGGLRDYDPAILSGIRRRPNRKADDRRFAAYDRAAAVSRELTEQERRVRVAERQVIEAKRNEAAPCDIDGLQPGWLVRDRSGWHRVVRANAKSVSVETPWSWTDRIPLDRILETRAA